MKGKTKITFGIVTPTILIPCTHPNTSSKKLILIKWRIIFRAWRSYKS